MKGDINMEKTAIFTIVKGARGYDIKCKAYNTYNRYGLAKDEIMTAMEQITDVFNNVLEIAVLFEVE